MLLKLLKTDFKYYARKFSPIMICLAILFIFMSILSAKIILDQTQMNINIISDNILASLILLIFVILPMFIYIYSILILINSIKEKLVSPVGYLNFSLPVKKDLHMWSNLIIFSTWIIIVILASILAFAIPIEFMSLFSHELYSVIRGIIQASLPFININKFILYITEIAVSGIVSILTVYFCTILVNTTWLKRFSKTFGIFIFIIILFIENSIILVYKFRLLKFDADIAVLPYAKGTSAPLEYFLVPICIHIILGVLLFFGTSFLVNKKLELD